MSNILCIVLVAETNTRLCRRGNPRWNIKQALKPKSDQDSYEMEHTNQIVS